MLIKTAVRDSEIFTSIVDKSGQEDLDLKVSYQQLKSGSVEIRGKAVRTAPLSSIKRAREIADILKQQIISSEFLLTSPVEMLPKTNKISKP